MVLVLAAPAGAQESNPIVNPDAVVDPTVSDGTNTEPEPDPGTSTEPEPGTETEPDPGTGIEPEPGTQTEPPPAPPSSAAWGNAALRPQRAKAEEAASACVTNRPPISKMLGIGGSVQRDEGGWFSWVALTIAAGAALIAIGAYALNRRRTARDARTPVGPLEITATLVAIVSGVAGLAAQFIPGVGAQESPPAEARLAVREVLARITRGEYAEKTGAGMTDVPSIDRREVGQVFWLEVGLKGYRDKKPQLQYALYDPDRGGALLVGTGTTVGLKVEDSDSQTLVVPIWVGYPSSKHFQARFRLLDGGAVRQIAATETLPTSNHRYACPADT
ncbi:MAG TPA: hypothetical protein VF056_05540 [Thermoleophilaceae bacterium]